MVHAGHLLITAQGNDEQIKKSYKIIIGAVIGLAIVLTAYSVSNYVSKAALKATNYGNGL